MSFSYIYSAVCLAFALIFSASAHAQSLMESAVAGSVGMGALYGATKKFNGSSDAIVVVELLQRQGYTNISPVASSSAQYMAFHPTTGPVLLTVEPSTGQVLSAMPR